MKKAFTMAEVLITLGIIGVIAAMTLSSLISNYSDKVAAAKLKKIYALLSTSYQFAYNNYGAPNDWNLGDVSNHATSEDFENSKMMYEMLGTYMKLYKTCGKETGCFNSGYYKYSTNSTWSSIDNSTHRYKVITADGVSMAFHWYSSDCTHKDSELQICGMVFVDIDGTAGRGMWGYDLFRFFITKTVVVPDGAPKHIGEDFSHSECPAKGTQCAYWLLTYENRDYLRCKDLSFHGKTRCK